MKGAYYLQEALPIRLGDLLLKIEKKDPDALVLEIRGAPGMGHEDVRRLLLKKAHDLVPVLAVFSDADLKIQDEITTWTGVEQPPFHIEMSVEHKELPSWAKTQEYKDKVKEASRIDLGQVETWVAVACRWVHKAMVDSDPIDSFLATWIPVEFLGDRRRMVENANSPWISRLKRLLGRIADGRALPENIAKELSVIDPSMSKREAKSWYKMRGKILHWNVRGEVEQITDGDKKEMGQMSRRMISLLQRYLQKELRNETIPE